MIDYKSLAYVGKRGRAALGERPDHLDIESMIRIVDVRRGSKISNLTHIVYHAPAGYDWGIQNQASMDLSLSILFDFFFPEYVIKVDDGDFDFYGTFAWWLHVELSVSVVSVLSRLGFTMTGEHIVLWLAGSGVEIIDDRPQIVPGGLFDNLTRSEPKRFTWAEQYRPETE